MNKGYPLQVGVTGGIGSGKSLVCKIFALLGAPVYNADARARWLTDNNPRIKENIVAQFGTSAYKDDQLDRKFIADIVFNDQEKLNILNNIIHPKVGDDYTIWLNNQTARYVIKEAALMFESASHKMLDKIINIAAPEGIRIERVVKRDRFRSEKDIKAIIAQQLSEQERRARSDYIIVNDESKLVIPQVLNLHEYFFNLPSDSFKPSDGSG